MAKTFLVGSKSVEVTGKSTVEFLKEKIISKGDRKFSDDPFYVADIGDVFRKFKLWKSGLPRVDSFYAIKCNDDPVILELMTELDMGFDCASQQEIEKILDYGVSPSRIIFANPCKQISHLEYAAKRHVSKMTFDNMAELQKIKNVYPTAELLLRILPPDNTNDMHSQLGIKYGCCHKTADRLLRRARELDLSVIGVAFHVGCECEDIGVYLKTCKAAREVFDVAEDLGFNFTLLDIGGGFPGDKCTKYSFEEICSSLGPILDELFPPSVHVIAEPGRFFVASALTLVTSVIGKRDLEELADSTSKNIPNGKVKPHVSHPRFMYYINDGLFGSFLVSGLLKYLIEPTQCLTNGSSTDSQMFASSLWGQIPTGVDCLNSNCLLPRLEIGDWLVFSDKGHYSITTHTGFLSIPSPHIHYVLNEKYWSELKEFFSIEIKKRKLNENGH